MNILFTLALSRWQETGRDSNNCRHDLEDTGRTGLRNKQTNVKWEEKYAKSSLESIKPLREELYSFIEQNINKINVP